MGDFRNWIWSGFFAGVLAGILGAVYFLTQPEKLALLYPSGVQAADPAFGLSPSPIALRDGQAAPPLAAQAAPAASAPRADMALSPAGYVARPDSRSSAMMIANPPSPQPPIQAAVYAPDPRAPLHEASRPLAPVVQYGRASRDHLMGRALSPVHNLGQSAGASLSASGGKIQPRGFSADSSSVQSGDSATQQINQLRQNYQAKGSVGSDEAMKLLDSVSDKLRQAQQVANQAQNQGR